MRKLTLRKATLRCGGDYGRVVGGAVGKSLSRRQHLVYPDQHCPEHIHTRHTHEVGVKHVHFHVGKKFSTSKPKPFAKLYHEKVG